MYICFVCALQRGCVTWPRTKARATAPSNDTFSTAPHPDASVSPMAAVAEIRTTSEPVCRAKVLLPVSSAGIPTIPAIPTIDVSLR